MKKRTLNAFHLSFQEITLSKKGLKGMQTIQPPLLFILGIGFKSHYLEPQRITFTQLSLVFCFSGSPPSPPALLLPWVWPRAVPTYGPYGRFHSVCTSVLHATPVTSMSLSLAPSLCPRLLPHKHPWGAESSCQGLPSVELACFILSLIVLKHALCILRAQCSLMGNWGIWFCSVAKNAKGERARGFGSED